MDPAQDDLTLQSRRLFCTRTAYGLGSAALASLLVPKASEGAAPSSAPGLPGLPHFAPKAKRAIYLFMAGAPAQVDLLDYKPLMKEMFDEDLPDSVRMGQRLTTMTSKQARFPIAPSRFKFAKHGQSGAWVS